MQQLSTPAAAAPRQPRTEAVSTRGLAHVELYVGDARQAAHFYRTVLGFRPVGYAGLETGIKDRISILMEGAAGTRLILTSALSGGSPIAEFVRLHGDGVRDIALRVDDAEGALEGLAGLGARRVDGGEGAAPAITAFGEVIHSLVERADGALPPGFREVIGGQAGSDPGFTGIDHLAVCVEAGAMEERAEFYCGALGFRVIHRDDVATEKTAMRSVAVEGPGGLRLVLVEPAPGRAKSQVQEFLDFNAGPGVQHLAFSTGDIVASARALRAAGIDLLRTPPSYYEMLPARIGTIDEDLETLQREGILVDRDDWGYLLQTFSKAMQARPTLFLEVIQRRNARGFGGGNIRALFEALEREQALRGTL